MLGGRSRVAARMRENVFGSRRTGRRTQWADVFGLAPKGV
jgi:hypothetical protein